MTKEIVFFNDDTYTFVDMTFEDWKKSIIEESKNKKKRKSYTVTKETPLETK